jgi:hypothetical protein
MGQFSRGELMTKSTARVFSRAFKLSVLNRMAAGENVSALARELQLRRASCFISGATSCALVGRPRYGREVGRGRRPWGPDELAGAALPVDRM